MAGGREVGSDFGEHLVESRCGNAGKDEGAKLSDDAAALSPCIRVRRSAAGRARKRRRTVS